MDRVSFGSAHQTIIMEVVLGSSGAHRGADLGRHRVFERGNQCAAAVHLHHHQGLHTNLHFLLGRRLRRRDVPLASLPHCQRDQHRHRTGSGLKLAGHISVGGSVFAELSSVWWSAVGSIANASGPGFLPGGHGHSVPLCAAQRGLHRAYRADGGVATAGSLVVLGGPVLAAVHTGVLGPGWADIAAADRGGGAFAAHHLVAEHGRDRAGQGDSADPSRHGALPREHVSAQRRGHRAVHRRVVLLQAPQNRSADSGQGPVPHR